MTVDDLLDMKNLDFTAYVRTHIGDDDRDIWDTLLDPDIANITRDALTAITLDIEGQLGQRKARIEAFRNECDFRPNGRREFFDAQAEYNTWRQRAMGFKRLVRRRLDEARSAAAEANENARPHSISPRGTAPQPNQVKIQHNIRSLFTLAYAVLRHRDACLASGMIPEPHDIALWEQLDSCSAFSAERGAQSLSEWLGHVMSKPGWVPPGEGR